MDKSMNSRMQRGQAPQGRPYSQPPTGRREPQQRRVKSRWFRAILMVLATLAGCVFLAIFMLRSASDLFGLNQPDQQYEVQIPEEASISEIADILQESGVIDTKLTFHLYALLKKDEKYHGGNYIFNSNDGYDEILVDLRTGRSQKEIVSLYFTEGRNVYEIANLLEEFDVCEAQVFLDTLESETFEYDFIENLPDSELRFRKLEGYIFPDTYEFYVGESPKQVANKFLSNFDSKIDQEMRDRMLELDLTLDQVVTIASIIQKDASSGTEEDMKLISSVLHNRLRLPESYPKLQSDVTKYYVTSFIRPFHDLLNQEMYDAYNTYEADGLPIGPICNPGVDAINAALYPAATEDPCYFYVVDVQGKVYPAVDESQHYRNIREARKAEGEGKLHGLDTE